MNFKKQMNTDAGWGVTMLRLVTGIIYAEHGYDKFLTLEGKAAFFDSIGIPMAALMAPVVATVEGVGGVLIVLGLFTRFVSALQAFVVLVAIVLVHFDNGMFAQGGYQWALLLMAASLCLLVEGGGKLSLDKKLG